MIFVSFPSRTIIITKSEAGIVQIRFRSFCIAQMLIVKILGLQHIEKDICSRRGGKNEAKQKLKTHEKSQGERHSRQSNEKRRVKEYGKI